MNISAPLLRPLPPVNFDAWRATCIELATALAQGSRVIALVGPTGSGKSYTLHSFAMAPTTAGKRAVIRAPWQPIDPSLWLDLVDDVDEDGIERLAAEPAFHGKRVLAVQPDALDAVLDSFPDAQVVMVRPLSARDVQMLAEARHKLLNGQQDALSPRTLAVLTQFCGGNPERLDELYLRAASLARTANAHGILADHVEQALSVDAMSARERPVDHEPSDDTDASTGRSDEDATHDAAIENQMARSAWEHLKQSPGPEVLAAARRARRIKWTRYAVFASAPLAALAFVLLPGPIGRLIGRPAPVLNADWSIRLGAPIGVPRQPANQSQPVAVAADPAPAAREAAAPTTAPQPSAGKPDAAEVGKLTNAATLFAIGKALLSIGQMADARSMFAASARMGNPEAATILKTNASAFAGSPAEKPLAQQ